MAIITRITNQKRKNRVNIFVDGKFFCGLEKETVLKNKLKENLEIDTLLIEKVTCESETKVAFEKAVSKISRKLCTQKEIEVFLEKRGFLSQAVENCVKKLKEYNYLADKNYAEAFVRCGKKFGKKALNFKLKQKGVGKTEIECALQSLDEEAELEKALKLSEKYLKNKEKTKEIKTKLFRYVLNHGFEYEVAKKCVERIFLEEIEENDSWN